MILVAGALLAELAPIVAALEDRRRLGRRLVRGRLERCEVAVLRCGVGPDTAGARTRRALAQVPCERVISVGTCGALGGGLRVGEVVSAGRLAWEEGGEVPVLPLPGPREVALVTVREVVRAPERRARLFEAGHLACEMEAAAVGEAAGDLPLSALKVVSDLAGEDGPHRPGLFDHAAFQLAARRLSASGLLPALRQALATP